MGKKRCNGIYCSVVEDVIRSLLVTPYEKTTCGSGKWCVAGVCTADSRVSTGDCLVPTDLDYCLDRESLWGKEFVCDFLGRSICCEFCNAGFTTIPAKSTTKTIQEWLKLKQDDDDVDGIVKLL